MASFKEFLRNQTPVNESTTLMLQVKKVTVADPIVEMMMEKNKDCNDMGSFLKIVNRLIEATTYDVMVFAIMGTDDVFSREYRPSAAVKNADKCMARLLNREWTRYDVCIEDERANLRAYKAHRLIEQLDISPKETWSITPKTIKAPLEPWDGADKAKAKKWDTWLKNLYTSIGTSYNEMVVKSITSQNLYHWTHLTKDYQKLIHKMHSYLLDVRYEFKDELEKLF